ncbi:hypothetical protein G6F23_012436 [Rhizopus arrhizus]|nr:hypothetical protein G6F23_012436 [Rhizopus arrhizus]
MSLKELASCAWTMPPLPPPPPMLCATMPAEPVPSVAMMPVDQRVADGRCLDRRQDAAAVAAAAADALRHHAVALRGGCADRPIVGEDDRAAVARPLPRAAVGDRQRDGTAGIVAYLRRDRDGARVGHPAVAAATTDALCQHAVALRAQRRDRALAGLRERHGARRTAIAALAAGCHQLDQAAVAGRAARAADRAGGDDAGGVGVTANAAAAADALQDHGGAVVAGRVDVAGIRHRHAAACAARPAMATAHADDAVAGRRHPAAAARAIGDDGRGVVAEGADGPRVGDGDCLAGDSACAAVAAWAEGAAGTARPALAAQSSEERRVGEAGSARGAA